MRAQPVARFQHGRTGGNVFAGLAPIAAALEARRQYGKLAFDAHVFLHEDRIGALRHRGAREHARGRAPTQRLRHRMAGCTAPDDRQACGRVRIEIGERNRIAVDGRIVVRQAAQRTAAEQLNKNLLLTRTSQVDAKPQLEIFADDVKCTHGATVGQLDAEELFYLQSRAIPTEVARRMLTVGFATDILERLGSEQVQAYVTGLVESRFVATIAAGE